MNLYTPIKGIHFVLLVLIGCTSFQYSDIKFQRDTSMVSTEKKYSHEEEGSEWHQIVNYEGVSIFYKLMNENDCEKFLLKIENESNQNKEIVFGVGGQIKDHPCKELFNSMNDYNVRKIVVEAFDEVVGDENTPNLLIFKTNDYEPLESIIQNLQIKTI